MKTYKPIRNYIVAGISFCIVIACIILIKTTADRQLWAVITLTVALLLFGTTMDNILKQYSLKNAIESKKRIEIEEHDERNTLLRDKARSTTNTVMNYAYLIVLNVLAFMNAELWILGLFAGLIVLQSVLAICLRTYYAKKY